MRMDDERRIYTYSWHQSHDQATVLLLVPYDTLAEDVFVLIEQNFLIAGVRGQPAVIKGQLYDRVNTISSVWQLEPRATRERTISTTSTISTQSSFAFVSDPEISSSFAASLNGEPSSDVDENDFKFPRATSPTKRPRSEGNILGISSGQIPFAFSSYSSVDSLHAEQPGRLLTLHLEKQNQTIWPSLIVGPVSESLSPIVSNPSSLDVKLEEKYNMDLTSLGLLAEDLFGVQDKKEEAFEYFVRAWHQTHSALLTLRLVAHYFPLQPAESNQSDSSTGSGNYYLQRIGGQAYLARLYLDAGFLYLEGTAEHLRMMASQNSINPIDFEPPPMQNSDYDTDEWSRDRKLARRYFSHAKQLCPQLEIPVLLNGFDWQLGDTNQEASNKHLKLPALNMHALLEPSAETALPSTEQSSTSVQLRQRRQMKDTPHNSSSEVDGSALVDDDGSNAWYLYLPGLIGAGTALVVVGIISAISFSTWRKNQG